ncbi:hypothetical protein B0A81_17620 [Flavobacterium plurextorum]|uniref:Uncharacterized protein n=1 Tax=Flavobacterium plurextorum TaxID=1114867 RepID=A0ABX4CQG6_9FLAO|nr:hypothetical protein [Flavobacterium plurextorum]OXB03820.1 hypothetical protein B0A81_17620 [Flavobacterium plurextorum]
MKKKELQRYLEKGTDIAGGAIGGALGLIGGPVGAIAGGALGVTITHVIKEFINRQLSNRQEVRVSASTVYILTGINNKLENGEQIRQDNFFDNQNGRSNAEELFEGVILKCKDQYQEKKIHFLSKIYEKTVFDENITYGTANQVLSLAESFTYRKMCIVSFYKRINDYDRTQILRDPYCWYPNATYSIETEMLKQDVFELMNLGILDSNNMMTNTRNDIVPNNFKLTSIGEILFSLMDLNEVINEDVDPIYEGLKYKDEFGISQNGGKNRGIPGQ